MMLRAARTRIAPGGLIAVAVALLSAAVGLVAVPAGAAPSTKYYLSTATPSSMDVSTADPPARTTVTFTLTNCGSKTSGCTKASTQSWGSAHVTLPSGWSWGYDTTAGPAAVATLVVHNADGSQSGKTSDWKVSQVITDSAGNTVVELGNDGTSSTYAIAPGEYLTFTASLQQTPAGLAAVTTEVKQSNDFSGTGNDFLHASGNTDPNIVIGPPDHLVFGVPPQTVQQTTTVNGTTTYYYMCDDANHGPTVRVVDKLGNTVTWTSGTVTLLNKTPPNADGTTPDPGLSYASGSPLTHSSTLQETISSGVATFGSGCTSGLSAAHLGSYVLGASAAVTGVGTVPMLTTDQKSYAVLQYYQPCGATTTCDTKTLGSGHTTVDVQGTGNPDNPTTNRLAASVHVFSQLSTCSGDDGNIYRDIVSVDLANHSKNVLLAWDKTAVQWSVNNGTPFWDVCMWATFQFPTRVGTPDATQVPGTTFWVGVLPDCGSAGLTSSDPCIASLYRRAGVEYASVTLPLTMPGDPQFK